MSKDSHFGSPDWHGRHCPHCPHYPVQAAYLEIWSGIYSPNRTYRTWKSINKKSPKNQLHQVIWCPFQWSSVHPFPALLPSSLRAAEGKGGHVGNGGRGLRVGLLNMKWHRYPLSLGSTVALFLCKFSPRQGRPVLVFEVNSRILWFFANTSDSKTKEPRFGSGWWNLRNGLAISEEDDLFFSSDKAYKWAYNKTSTCLNSTYILKKGYKQVDRLSSFPFFFGTLNLKIESDQHRYSNKSPAVFWGFQREHLLVFHWRPHCSDCSTFQRSGPNDSTPTGLSQWQHKMTPPDHPALGKVCSFCENP